MSLAVVLTSVNAACAGYRPVSTVDLTHGQEPRQIEGTPLTELWVTRAGRGLAPSIGFSDTVVYLGAADRNVRAVDLRNGVERWSIRIGGQIAEGVIADGDKVFAATERPDGRVYALNAVRGMKVWSTETGSAAAPLALVHGRLLVATRDGVLLSLNPKDGTIGWRRQIGLSLAAPVEEPGGMALVGTVDSLFRLEVATGRIVERRTTPGVVLSPWVTRPGYRLAGTTDSLVIGMSDDTLAGGWSVRLDAPVFGSPVVLRDTAYAVSRIGTVYRIPLMSPEPKAEAILRLRTPVTSSPVIFQDWLVVGTAGGQLLALTLGGTIGWEMRVSAPVDQTPLILPDGFLAIGGRGEVRRLRI